MNANDPNTTFAGYTALALVAAVVVIPQIGLVGLIAAGASVYAGACFMRGYTSAGRTRR